MSRETSYQAIIIKRQPYGEGDEILTLFTREAGKVRALAKATKMSKSKMRHALQTLFLVKLTVTSVSSLPKIIGAETVKPFAKIRAGLEAINMAFYALELLLKFTADEHKNERLFVLVEEFLDLLDSAAANKQILNLGLAKFKIEFLESSGLGIHYEESKKTGRVGFDSMRGGFVFDEDAERTGRPVARQVFDLFLSLKHFSFGQIGDKENLKVLSGFDLKPLQELLSGFIKYHLEREIKSEKYLEE